MLLGQAALNSKKQIRLRCRNCIRSSIVLALGPDRVCIERISEGGTDDGEFRRADWRSSSLDLAGSIVVVAYVMSRRLIG